MNNYFDFKLVSL